MTLRRAAANVTAILRRRPVGGQLRHQERGAWGAQAGDLIVAGPGEKTPLLPLLMSLKSADGTL